MPCIKSKFKIYLTGRKTKELKKFTKSPAKLPSELYFLKKAF